MKDIINSVSGKLLDTFKTPPMQKTNIIQVLKNKTERAKATFVISGNNSFYLYKGDRIKEHHFDLILPIKIKPL